MNTEPLAKFGSYRFCGSVVFVRSLLIVLSFIFATLGQNAWVGWLGPLAAIAGYALFWRAIIDWATAKQQFFLGFAWFFLVQAVQLSWMATTEYMGLLILTVYAGLIVALGLQFGLLSWLVGRTQSLTVFRCAALAGVWVLLEWIRLHLCTGFTWNPAGLALTTSTLSLQMASLFGIFGLSFWVIFVNLIGLRASTVRSPVSIVAWIAGGLFPYIFGLVQCSIVPKEQRTLATLLVQTALLPEQRSFDFAYPDRFIDPIDQIERIIQIIESAQAPHADLIVLPEGAVPYEAFQCAYPFFEIQHMWIKFFGTASLNELPLLGQAIKKEISREEIVNNHSYWKVSNAFFMQALANHYHCEVIVGMDDRDEETKNHYNAAFHFLPNSHSASRIEKRVLVPVGEYVPLQNWRWFAKFVSKHFGIGESFDAGKEAKVFLGRIAMGVSICYEETFSEMIRHLRQKKAQMFVNISNDVWFPRSRLAKQHFDHGMVRAVENGIPLIRSCNTGVTCGVDCCGGLIAQFPENLPGALFLELPLRSFPTLYSKLGDGAILALSAFFALNLLKKRRGTCSK